MTPPFAERAAKSGQPAKAVMLWVFFALALGFSLSSSISRSSSYATGKIVHVEQANEKAGLAQEAYAPDQKAAEAECATGRGPQCHKLEDKVDADRKALATAAPTQSTDPGAERIATVLGVDENEVQLYLPLLLPLGLELGGFIFLATGLAPAALRRDTEPEIVNLEPVEISTPAVANPSSARVLRGGNIYYMARLQRDHPALAKQVDDGAISYYRACVQAGIRKAPAKSKWTKIDAHLEQPADA